MKDPVPSTVAQSVELFRHSCHSRSSAIRSSCTAGTVAAFTRAICAVTVATSRCSGGVDERAAVQLERRGVHPRGGGVGLVAVASAWCG